ncbi:AIPR family protein [Kitasatospora sp. NPDC096128]|uniref:AIPR family protein n=1 Tax=Kitasatospora sp. NPDC096128 TaxID=3155547 RepID=UPI003321980B
MDRITESFLREFSQERQIGHEPQSEQFEAFAAYCVLSSEHDGEFDPVELRTGGGNDLAVDAAALVANGDIVTGSEEIDDLRIRNNYLQARILIVQAKTSGSFDAARITDLADNLCDFFSDSPTLPMSNELKDFKSLVDKLYENSTAFRKGSPDLVLRYVTTGTWTGDAHLSSKVAAATKRLEELNLFGSVSFECLGAKELQALYRSAKNTVESEFQFPNQVLIPEIEGVEQSYIGTVAASEYMRLICDSNGNIRKSLFYENVRDFQDYNDVNRGIRSTLQEERTRGRFVVLNNGITIVAREMGVVGNKFTLRDYQIVNGCQTSHVLFDEKDNLEGVHVPLRLIVTQDEDVASSVTAATNKQTLVSDEDLKALEVLQKELEAFFEAHPAEKRLYYERRSKQYSAVAGLEKTRIVTRPQLVRSYAAMMLNEPWRAGRYYAELLRIRGSEIFKAGDLPDPYYVAAVASYRLEYFFRNGYVDGRYKPARYQILMAIRHYIEPGEVPTRRRELERYCARISDRLWDLQEGPALIQAILPAIDSAVAATESDGILDRDTVRTQAFTDLVIKGIATLLQAK